MPSKGGVVGLDVELEVLVEVVGFQKSNARLRVVVVLVLHGFARLRLDQQLEVGLVMHAQETGKQDRSSECNYEQSQRTDRIQARVVREQW